MNEKKEFYKKLMALVLPIAFQQFMFAAVSASDALMLGFLSQDDLSAVSLAGQVQFVYNLFLIALTTGTTVLAAQYWGKKDSVAVEKVFAIVVRISMLISIAFFFATLFVPELLMKIFTPEDTLVKKGVIYLKMAAPTFLLTGISQIYLAIMKNIGNAFKSTVINATCMLLDVVLNALFIYGLWIFPTMGIAGAAFTTVVSRMVELTWILIDNGRKGDVHLHIKYVLHVHKMLHKDFWKYTLPVMGSQLVWGGGFSMYTVIMGHLGNDAVAANSIANIVKDLLVCICLGIAAGGGIVVGNELGKGALENAKLYGNRLIKMSLVSGIATGGILLCLSFLIVPLFNLSGQAASYLHIMLIMCSYYVAGKAINVTAVSGIFSSGGDTKFGFICDAITMWGVIIPLGFIGAFWLKLPVLVVYFILNSEEIVKLPMVLRHYKKYLWVKDLTRKSVDQSEVNA